MLLGTIQTIMTGRAVPFTRPGTFSGINKRPRLGSVSVGIEGFEGDEQGDRRVHGGPDKALHHYPYDHYRHWREAFGHRELLAAPGAFGENISTVGVTEENICMGDIISCGSTVLEVSQTRQPCWKLDDRLGIRGAAFEMQRSGKVGWYYRVLEPGTIEAGAALDLLERPNPEWPLRKVLQLLYVNTMNLDALTRLQSLRLPPSWQKLVANRIRTSTVESWDKRLGGPEPDASESHDDAFPLKARRLVRDAQIPNAPVTAEDAK